MTKIKKFKIKVKDYFFDHYKQKAVIDYTWLAIASCFSAFIYAFGFSTFITPISNTGFTVVTGGLSGISQTIVLIFEMCGIKLGTNTLQSVIYFIINIPLIVFAFLKIGKRFSIFSLINVGLSSLFIFLLSNYWTPFMNPIAEIVQKNDVTRILLAAVCTGVSSGILFKANISAGGMDIVSYYFALKKSSNVGKYSIILNIGIIVTFALLKICQFPDNWATSLVALFYSILYLIGVAVVIDLINVRNKKVQLQIITTNKNLIDVLLSNFPHGATISTGKGAFTEEDKLIIYMVISSVETNKVVSLVKQVDVHAFVSALSLIQVYGNFFIKPVK